MLSTTTHDKCRRCKRGGLDGYINMIKIIFPGDEGARTITGGKRMMCMEMGQCDHCEPDADAA